MTGDMIGIHTRALVLVAPAVVAVALGFALVHRARRPLTIDPFTAQWPHTSGTVLSATVKVRGKGTVRQEAPLVLYAYQVDGEVYQGNRVRVDGAGDASGAVARYPAGACVTVYYDPTNPANSMLER